MKTLLIFSLRGEGFRVRLTTLQQVPRQYGGGFRGRLLLLSPLLLLAFIPPTDLPRDVAQAYKDITYAIDYNQHVKPILSDKCFACHGPDKAKQKAGLRLDIAASAYASLPESPGKVAITPKNLKKSEVFHRIISTDPTYMMPSPKSHLTLSAQEKAILIKWIEQGAVYQPHWAFVKPTKKPLPTPTNSLSKNPIDLFVSKKLTEEKLQFAPEASKEILLRRVSLDLTGLPPTPKEIDDFLKDNAPNAYEKQIDRLLKSVHYGEKRASEWLDLARFADSHGYTVDRLRDMSPYRDWVIKAFNQNMSYKDFIHQQLAGDLMPNPTKDMLIATAFNRNHPQNMEGGIVEEEFQTEYVIDRTNTLGDAFMSISVGCARCHDHKYDPISQKNYYELYSFFNNVREAGQISWNDDLPTPTLMLPTDEQEKTLDFIKNNIKQQEQNLKNAQQTATQNFEQWLKNESYKSLTFSKIPQLGLQGFYDFEDSLRNTLNPKQTGVMKRDAGTLGDKPVFEKYENGKALLLDGDVYLDLYPVGIFRKSEAFSVGIHVFIPKELKEGVILHKSDAERLYNFKGYHLLMKNNRLEVTLAHTAPSNAITKLSAHDVPRNQWIHLTITYDGSAQVDGLHLYLNGNLLPTETVINQLYKDIIFFKKTEPALQIGGWWRGLGFKGGKADNIAIYNRQLTPHEVSILAGKEIDENIAKTPANQLTTNQLSFLKDLYISAVDSSVLSARRELQKWRTMLSDSSEKIAEVMVMQEMPTPKKAYMLKRGEYNNFGEEVLPNTPETILKFPAHLPKNRYGLAQWLTHDDHPLTARVAVNHLWQSMFGMGLVKTSEDFGNQGQMPFYLDLLDWLAIDFRESGWDVKRMLKQMVMSATYRQQSNATPQLKEYDPENRLLARGPSARLTAEMLRDNALLASGLLNKKVGGKSVKPYQPDGLWEINNTSYKADTTDAIYRRSLYALLKRSVPNPTLSTFDLASRNSCIARRQPTNTPLQALVTLNDPTFVEAAKAMGEKASYESTPQKAITQIYSRLTGRTPTDREVALLTDLYQQEQMKFKQNPAKSKGWLQTGYYKIQDKTLDTATVAAYTVVASTVMNSNATIMKR